MLWAVEATGQHPAALLRAGWSTQEIAEACGAKWIAAQMQAEFEASLTGTKVK